MRENRMRRNPEVSDGRSIHVGLVGPKPRLKSVGDGQPVNNPVPGCRSEGERGCEGQPLNGLRCQTGEAKKETGKSVS